MPRRLQLCQQADLSDERITTWVDMDLRDAETTEWIQSQPDLPPHLLEHLNSVDEFSRREIVDEGLLICFHPGMNHDRGAETPTALGVWIEKDRVITAHTGPSPVCDALYEAASQQPDQWTPFHILAYLVRYNVKQIEPVISDIAGKTAQLEDQFFDARDELDEERLNRMRQLSIRTRRHFIDIRNLLAFIISDESLPITDRERRALVSAKSHVLSYLESLEDCRERAELLQNQIEARLAERLNRITLNLTVLATVFLPLSFLTGMLGMNVAGIPDEHNPHGFLIVCIIMVVIAVSFWLFLRWRRWT